MKVRKAWIGSKKPATLGHLAELQEGIHLDLNQTKREIVDKLDQSKEEILYEFRAVAEIIHKDVASANRDEISWIKDMIKAIMRHVGMLAK